MSSTLFAVAKAQLDAVIGSLKERADPAGTGHRTPSMAVLYSDPERQRYENIMRQHLEGFGSKADPVWPAEDENSMVQGPPHLLRCKPCVILVASKQTHNPLETRKILETTLPCEPVPERVCRGFKSRLAIVRT